MVSKSNSKKLKFLTLAGATLLIASTTGCGAQSALPAKKTSKITSTAGGGVSTGGSASTSGAATGTAGNGTGTTVITGVPALTMRVGTIGYNSVTVTVHANKVLKVAFSPGQQDEKVAGTGFSPAYGQLGVYLKVGSTTQPTAMLSNGLNGGSQEIGTPLDFSGDVPSCGSSTTCRSTVTITVLQPNNDYWCMNFGQYCPWTHVYPTHPWHGTLYVQTDDTDTIPTQ